MSATNPVSSAEHACRSETSPNSQPGSGADGPGELGIDGCKAIAFGIKDRSKAERLPLLAAGVAFFALFSLVPALGAAVLAIVAVFSLTFLPALARRTLGDTGGLLVTWLRWPMLGLLVLVALSVLNRSGPERESPRLRWVTPGSVFAVVAWLIGSFGFSVYVTQFGGQFEAYGQLGAYVNAEMEHQTSRDTTSGESEPRGERGAVMSDHEPLS